MAFVPLFGYEADPVGAEAFVASLPHPTLADAGPDLQAAKHDVSLSELLLACEPGWKRGSQPIGSCVGWGVAMSVDCLAVADVLLRKEAEVWGGLCVPGVVYGLSRVEARGQRRNMGGDGSTGYHAAKAIRDFGTLHFGRDYGGTTYKAPLSGTQETALGRDGLPDDLEPYAAKHTVAEVTLVRSFDDCAKAISNGFPVFLCSMQGFAMKFREYPGLGGGWLVPMGTWPHCMMACDLRWDRPALRVPNSWGNCYDGPVDEKAPEAMQRSAGWVDAEVIDEMCKGGDSYAVAGFHGFQPSNMPETGWLRGVL
jgi:hypothetical protein